MEATVEEVKGILKKMKVQFTPEIKQAQAEAKLARAIQDRNVPVPWTELTERELQVLADMGFEPKEKIVSKAEPEPGKPKETPQVAEPPKAEATPSTAGEKAPEPNAEAKGTAEEPKKKTNRTPRKKGEGARDIFKNFFKAGEQYNRKKVIDDLSKSTNVQSWTIANYIAEAKKSKEPFGYTLEETKDAEGNRLLTRKD